MCVGAEVAEEPRVCAGVEVWIGAETVAADIVPGSMHPPCTMHNRYVRNYETASIEVPR